MAYRVNGKEVNTLSEVAEVLGVSRVSKKDIESGKYDVVEITEEVTNMVKLNEVMGNEETKEEVAVQEGAVELPENVKAMIEQAQAMVEASQEEGDTKEPVVEVVVVKDAPKEVEGDTNEEPTNEEGPSTDSTTDDSEDTESTEDDTTDEDVADTDATDDSQDLEPAKQELVQLEGESKLDFLKRQMAAKNATNKPKEDAVPVPEFTGEFPEVGFFKDQKVMKKYMKKVTDEQLLEWLELEGLTFKPNEHAGINRMRMSMAIQDKHFPKEPSKSAKKKSKYSDFTTEELVEMAINNDIEVKEDKGDVRILRMYTIVALRNAGLLE